MQTYVQLPSYPVGWMSKAFSSALLKHTLCAHACISVCAYCVCVSYTYLKGTKTNIKTYLNRMYMSNMILN